MLVKLLKWLREFKLMFIQRCIPYSDKRKLDRELQFKAALTIFKNNCVNKSQGL
jgi:hypothetical protein